MTSRTLLYGLIAAGLSALFFTVVTLGAPLSDGEPPDATLRAGLSQTLGTPDMPFWLHANRDGRVPLDASRVTILFGEYHIRLLQDARGWDLDAGLRLDARFSDAGVSDNANRTGFGELYTHLRLGGWQISAGRFPDVIGLAPEYLSTGSMLMSRNALPPWRIRLSTPDFLPVPLTGGVLSFKARWSEGLLTDERYVDRARIHQKYLYLKVQPAERWHVVAGIVHNLMWGGTHPNLGRLHSTVGDWLDDVFIRPDTRFYHNATPVGNSLGGYDFGVLYRGGTWEAGAWRLFYIEDGQSMDLSNPWDGMWGAYLRRADGSGTTRPVRYVVYEHVNTKKQDAGPWDAIGRGRYYSHNIYRDGWVHHGQVMGTPLILIDPERTGDRSRNLVNSILLAHHVGLAGELAARWSHELLLTYSRNYGICTDQTQGGSCNGSVDDPVQEREGYIPLRELRRDRYSMMVRLAWDPAPVTVAGQPRRMRVHLALALDAGAFHSSPLAGVETGVRMAF